MLSRLQHVESDSSVDFFYTHPSSAKRVEELSKLLPKAYDVLNANPHCAAIRTRFGVPLKSFDVRSLGIGFDDIF
ncbi:hypothetical protein C0992_011786 [Termitomyces sp. T32_za158]|nr:hypothetical protein C0992_011786 [Termitomyces sp. T32_za158]